MITVLEIVSTLCEYHELVLEGTFSIPDLISPPFSFSFLFISLQGSAPWTVVYSFAGKQASASIKTPEFSRVADKPGELRIESVAHQQNKCKHELKKEQDSNLVKTVHALPTVKVSAGRHFVEDLREGNQAEIIFDLVGIPPFSFTYQRTETVDTHSNPKILETHTVSLCFCRLARKEEGQAAHF